MQILCVLLKQRVCHVRDLSFGFHGRIRMCHGKGEDHLALPQRDGVYYRGADLFSHEVVVVLDEPDLRRHLDGYHSGKFQIVDLLFKAAYHVCKIICRLSVLGKSGFLGLLLVLREFLVSELLYLELTGYDVHGELFQVLKVLLVHSVHEADILHQNHLMLLQLLDYLVYIDLCLVVLGFKGIDILLCLFEKTEETLFLFLVEIEALELDDEISEHFSDLAEILCLDCFERAFGEISDILLGVAAVV